MGRKSELGFGEFEIRCPGLRQQVDAMLEAFVPSRQIAATIQAQFRVHIGYTTICLYKRKFWNARRDRLLAKKAFECAVQELASEERN